MGRGKGRRGTCAENTVRVGSLRGDEDLYGRENKATVVIIMMGTQDVGSCIWKRLKEGAVREFLLELTYYRCPNRLGVGISFQLGHY